MAARILVIDDVQEILDMYSLLLKSEGYEVLTSLFPHQNAIEVAQQRPALIVLDIMFRTERLGLYLFQKLKAHPSTRSIPVVISTAAEYELYDYVPDLLAQGAVIFYKPFDVSEFLQTIATLLASSPL